MLARNLVLAPWRLEMLTDADAQCLGDALVAALGADQWRVLPGDWPSDRELPATVPARPSEWRGLRFRSQSELRVARALERAGAAFSPTLAARVGPTADARESREVDFLVMSRGNVGGSRSTARRTRPGRRPTMSAIGYSATMGCAWWSGSTRGAATGCPTTWWPSSCAC
jgi:hypothetical protein